MRILMIEPDLATANSVALMLKSRGHNVEHVELGEDGFALAKDFDYSLIILEPGLPDMNGLDLIKWWRDGKVATPVLVLSGYADVDHKVRALSAGADDYLTKPFHVDELIARVGAIVRRSVGLPESRVTTGNTVLDLRERTFTVDGRRIHLTNKEYEVLELLSLRKGTTLTKDMFLNHLYGGMDEPEIKIIDVFMCKLRRRLADAGATGLIETVWGRGYTLRDPASVEVVAQ